MPSLTEIVRISPRQSGIDMLCELDPKHPMTKTYAVVEISRTVITRIDDIDKPLDVKFTLRACPLCLSTFAYDVSLMAREVSAGKST